MYFSYSLDEGSTWESLQFTEEKIRVYGLMVEPGEKTTIFTLFGSRENMHEWLLFKIDLKSLLGPFLFFKITMITDNEAQILSRICCKIRRKKMR